jgi:hypothetical protein
MDQAIKPGEDEDGSKDDEDSASGGRDGAGIGVCGVAHGAVANECGGTSVKLKFTRRPRREKTFRIRRVR